jgi:rhomboid family GlyGly-CTERM serine protease
MAGATALLMAGIEVGGTSLRPLFWLESGAVRGGEVWRLATAHFVNLGPVHTWLNILGVGLILCTLRAVLTPGRLARAVVASGGAVSVGWVALVPEGVTYVGFSGITHGVLAYGGLALLRDGPRWFGAVVVVCVAAKLGWEGMIGAVPGADTAIGGRVSFLSHALAVLGGVIAAERTALLPRLLLVGAAGALVMHHLALEMAAS